jgi:hypothetical protein
MVLVSASVTIQVLTIQVLTTSLRPGPCLEGKEHILRGVTAGGVLRRGAGN